jgi:cysteine-rich repeat protein
VEGYCRFVPPCDDDLDCAADERCIQGKCLTRAMIASLPPFCGNARLDPGEECDDGGRNSDVPNALCRPDCTLGRCGDSILDTPLELCDDGNLLSGDGCSQSCQIERSAPIDPSTLPATIIDLPAPGSAASAGGTPVIGAGTRPPPATADSGPAALLAMIAGAAAGWAVMRRRRG